MKVIFLDIDGVLNGHEKWENGYCGINPFNVQELNKVLNLLPSVKLVISSSWRYMIPEAMTLKGFEYLLLISGLNCKERLIGVTERDEVCNTRGKQIRRYLQQHPEIIRYIVIDDVEHDFEEQNINFILTNSKEGLVEKQARDIFKFLAINHTNK